MQRITVLVLALTLFAVPSMAGRLTSSMITHLDQVYQVYCGTAGYAPWCDEATDVALEFNGYKGMAGDLGGPTITAVPGILGIDPGHFYDEATDTWYYWPNFIGAYWDGVEYTIKNVTLVKHCPEYVQCNDRFPEHTVTQQGTPNIRLWWPLMYTTPSCTFTLTILYGTKVQYDDDGDGPNPPAWVHVEQWVWHVDADLDHLLLLLELFGELPYGRDEVPLISDETLYDALWLKIDDAITAYEAGDLAEAAAILTDFELEVMDACIEISPTSPNPTGPGTGIANSDENPACCKLLVDVEYILQVTGIGQPSKK